MHPANPGRVRNIAIHEYQELDTSVLKYIAEIGYKDFIDFAAQFGVHITPVKGFSRVNFVP